MHHALARALILVGALTRFAGLALADDAKPKQDSLRVEGSWTLKSIEADGQALELPEIAPKWVIKGGKVLYGGDELAVVKLDPAGTPKNIDLQFAHPKRLMEGVYELTADTLKICVNRQTEGVKERPQGFSTAGKPELRLLVFQRDKEPSNDVLDGVGGYVGVAIRFDKDRNLLLVDRTIDGSPARQAGLMKDDVLIKVGGANSTDLAEVVRLVRRQRPGHDLAFRVQRAGQEKEITVKVGKVPFYLLD